MAEVIPVPKVNSPHQCKQFRPIPLLFHCGKIAEKFTLKEYKAQILPKLNNNQYAYRTGLSTTDALIYAFDKWTKQIDSKSIKAIEVIFKDFFKTFDSMQPPNY